MDECKTLPMAQRCPSALRAVLIASAASQPHSTGSSIHVQHGGTPNPTTVE